MKKIVIPALLGFIAVSIFACGGETSTAPVTDTVVKAPEPEATPVVADKGKEIYSSKCMACHQENGTGIEKTFPPLAKSDFLGNKEAVIEQVINGKSGKMTVNGVEYDNVMPPQELSDEDIAAVLTYVYSSWENSGGTVTVEEVKKVREKIKK